MESFDGIAGFVETLIHPDGHSWLAANLGKEYPPLKVFAQQDSDSQDENFGPGRARSHSLKKPKLAASSGQGAARGAQQRKHLPSGGKTASSQVFVCGFPLLMCVG